MDIISYFHLAGYWRHLEQDHNTRQFKENIRFRDILALYNFDKGLRLLLFSAIQDIEVAMRSKIIKHFAPEFGAFWFMNPNYAISQTHFDSNLEHIRKEVSRSHNDFITEHYQKYSEPDLPPVWKTLEVISFGTLSKLFSNFLAADVKHKVAREFGLNHHKFLKSWLESLSALRNCCAHHSRVFNVIYPAPPQLPTQMPNIWITDFSFRRQSIYPQLCCIIYWLNTIYHENTFKQDFKRLLIKYPSVNPRLMGFPANWHTEPLWREE